MKNVVVGNVLLASKNEIQLQNLDTDVKETEDDIQANEINFQSRSRGLTNNRFKSIHAEDKNGLISQSQDNDLKVRMRTNTESIDKNR